MKVQMPDEAVIQIVDNIIENHHVEVDGVLRMGMSQSFLISTMRDKGLTVTGNDYAFLDYLETLGYHVGKGKSGKNTRKGFRYCVPCRCIYV